MKSHVVGFFFWLYTKYIKLWSVSLELFPECKPSELLYGKRNRAQVFLPDKKAVCNYAGIRDSFFSKKTLFLLLHILPSSRVPILDMET